MGTKGKDELDLNKRELQKIKHAQQYFNQARSQTQVIFKHQLKANTIADIIKAVLEENAARTLMPILR